MTLLMLKWKGLQTKYLILATITAVTAVKNKIANVSDFAKIINYNTKISEIENKIATGHSHHKNITTQEFNKLTSNFTATLKQENLASKIDIANFVKKGQILIIN